MNCLKCAATLLPGAEFCGLCGCSSKPVSKSIPALTPEVDLTEKKEAKVSEPIAKAIKKRRGRRFQSKRKEKLTTPKSFQRGPALVVEAPKKPDHNVPIPSPSQREILTDINMRMGVIATPLRTGEIQIIEEPEGGLASIYDQHKEVKAPPLPVALVASQESFGDYGALVSESSLQVISKPPQKVSVPPPLHAKKASDFEDFSAPETDLPKASPEPIRINTMELEIMEDPSEQMPSGYGEHVAPKSPSYSNLKVVVESNRDPAFLGPVVIQNKPQSSSSQDSGEIAIRKTAKKSKRFMVAALAMATAAVGAYIILTPPQPQDNTAQFVAAATPSITAQPTTMVIVSNDAKISDAAALAIQGKWKEAAALAEEADNPGLATRYLIEGEVNQNLQDCRKAREEKRLEDAMAACHLVALVQGSRSAQIATPEIEELKKSYKSRHIPLTKKEISRGDLANAKQEIDLLSLYLGAENPDTIILQRLYSEQTKKLSTKDKAITETNIPSSPKALPPSTPKPNLTPVATIPPTAAPAPELGMKAYSVSGVLVSLGGFTNKTKDPSLTSKFQSAISRNLTSSGKLTTSAGGKGPVTISGSIVKVETKNSGGKTSVIVGVSLQITRDSAFLGAITKEASAEFSGSITTGEEKAGKDEVIKALADDVFSSFKKSINKFK
jgi:hypothetical protein